MNCDIRYDLHSNIFEIRPKNSSSSPPTSSSQSRTRPSNICLGCKNGLMQVAPRMLGILRASGTLLLSMPTTMRIMTSLSPPLAWACYRNGWYLILARNTRKKTILARNTRKKTTVSSALVDGEMGTFPWKSYITPKCSINMTEPCSTGMYFANFTSAF
jgi:hypothetical protein